MPVYDDLSPAARTLATLPQPSPKRAVRDPGFRADVARGLADVGNRAVANTLGAPVDAMSILMRPFGYNHPAPVGGSEWIGNQMQNAGIVSSERRPAAEILSTLALPGAGVKAARGLSALADMSPAVTGSSAGRAPLAAQAGAISPEGKARLLADLQAGQGSGTYRLGDITQGQARALQEIGLPLSSSRDVMMTDRATRHLLEGRIQQDGFTPLEVVRFAEQAMAKRSRADISSSLTAQHPSLLNEGLRHTNGVMYDARMPLKAGETGYEVRSVMPDGIRTGSNKPQRR